jgi:hypothetical protein
MRSIAIVSLLVVYLAHGKSDVARQGLRGRVRSVTDCQCPVKNGSPDTGRCTVFVFKYDDSGRQYEDNEYVNGSIYRGFSELNHKHLYKYDDAGNQAEVDEYNPDGSLNQRVLYKYDQRGNRVEKCNYLRNGVLWFRSEYTFNEHDLQTECSKYNADSQLVEHYSYSYDSAGHMALEQHVIVRSRNGREDNGKGITFSPQNQERLTDYIKTFVYNDSGLMTRETDNLSNFPYPFETAYKYANFDENGNWLKQIAYHEGGGAVSITERVIEYY